MHTHLRTLTLGYLFAFLKLTAEPHKQKPKTKKCFFHGFQAGTGRTRNKLPEELQKVY